MFSSLKKEEKTPTSLSFEVDSGGGVGGAAGVVKL